MRIQTKERSRHGCRYKRTGAEDTICILGFVIDALRRVGISGRMQVVFDMLAQLPTPLLLVGGQALAAHRVVRRTLDIDCLIVVEDDERFRTHITKGGCPG